MDVTPGQVWAGRGEVEGRGVRGGWRRGGVRAVQHRCGGGGGGAAGVQGGRQGRPAGAATGPLPAVGARWSDGHYWTKLSLCVSNIFKRILEINKDC